MAIPSTASQVVVKFKTIESSYAAKWTNRQLPMDNPTTRQDKPVFKKVNSIVRQLKYANNR